MQELSPQEIDNRLSRAVSYYIQEVFSDTLTTVLRGEFKTLLSDAGYGEVVELSQDPADALIESGMDGELVYDGNYKLLRLVTPKEVTDIDDIRANPESFREDISAALSNYVDDLSADTVHASVPVLFVEKAGFQITWYLWGYHTVPL